MISKRKLEIYSSLASAKMRRKHGLFIVEGSKSVADTCDAFEVEAILRAEGSTFQPAVRCEMYDLTPQEMKKISNLMTPPEVIGVYRIPEKDGESVPAPDVDGLYVMLDGIQDPGNLGTIIRTCHWFGIRRIYASNDTVDIYNPKTVQATMGSLGKVEICYCDLPSLVDSNREIPLYGLLLEGKDIFKEKLGRRGFIAMGNEGNGLSDGIRERVTNPLTIPPHDSDHGESLNVAIATAIAVSCFAR